MVIRDLGRLVEVDVNAVGIPLRIRIWDSRSAIDIHEVLDRWSGSSDHPVGTANRETWCVATSLGICMLQSIRTTEPLSSERASDEWRLWGWVE